MEEKENKQITSMESQDVSTLALNDTELTQY
jgi:hypothetical protein